MRAKDNGNERDSLSAVIDALKGLDDEARARILKTVATFFNVGRVRYEGDLATARPVPELDSSGSNRLAAREPRFSDHADLSPKKFLEEKQPVSDVDRVACLAFYLAHYRDTPHFKTVDISKLNTEAAQFKFSNAAAAVNNAAAKGLLTSASNGRKQMSAIGEQFVAALPDREGAKKVLQRIRFRRDRGKQRPAKRPAKRS